MEIKGIKGLISLKLSLDDNEELRFLDGVNYEDSFFQWVREKIVDYMGYDLIDDLMICPAEHYIYVIVKVGAGRAYALCDREVAYGGSI